MTNRFVLAVLLIAVVSTMLFPHAASAQMQNKQRLVFEINKFQKIIMPDLIETVEPEPTPEITAVPVIIEKPAVYVIPEKVSVDERVYMHEPEIRAYICPKLGQKNCNIFIAVLKAENGTHECTRDNRGLNKNGSLDVGLAQINWNPKYNPPYTVEQLRDCKFNLDIALKKYEARGFQPWYAYTKGAYLKFLKPTPKVEVAVAVTQ